MYKSFDVIITGARCAGSSLALYLARAGFHVLLVDRSAFPSDTLSTHAFFNNTVALLRELGVMDTILETNPTPVKDIKFQFEDTVIEGVMPKVFNEEYCYCIRRTYLDNILLEHAKAQHNITVLEEFRVIDVIRDGDKVIGVKGLNSHNAEQEFFASLVVGADGRYSTIRKLVASKLKMSVPSKVAIYYGYFSNLPHDHTPKFEVYKTGDHTAILFATNEDAYVAVGIFPIANKELMATFKSNPEKSLRDFLMNEFKNTSIGDRLKQSTLIEPVKGIIGYESYWYQGMGRGWALVGDAVCFKDPGMAQGIHDAIYGARLLTHLFTKDKDKPYQWEALADQYQIALENEFMVRFQIGCKISQNERINEQQDTINKLISSDSEAIKKFLGIYNYVFEPAELESEIARIIQSTKKSK
ncbi:FAD-binding protein [Bacillus sp. SA1-12]|uniref:NAD(P)/FAD-dependent oxidoreductase n=1 Tax=Bacillus sp. SA1-12 TaxID=1455638 RepID=UPI00062747FA|nr:NAD(P)/FAD-dependent oxidoreductase [Bacillus sp. SA1-12]KKI90245.1 FAD-binding protein [Bacillus sp. SA1-12]